MAAIKTNEIEKVFTDFITQLEVRRTSSLKFVTEMKLELPDIKLKCVFDKTAGVSPILKVVAITDYNRDKENRFTAFAEARGYETHRVNYRSVNLCVYICE